MESNLSIQAVKRLGKELLASKAHINNVPALLSLISKVLDSSSSSSSDDCVLQALLALQAFFSPLLSRGELSSQSYEKAQQTLQEKACEHAQQAQAVYNAWLWDKYSEFVDMLLRIVGSPTISPPIQATSVDALMEFVRQEKQGDFSEKLYKKLCSTLVSSEHIKSQTLEHLVAEYFKYIDVCCHTCISLRKLIMEHHWPKHQGHEDDSTMEGTSLQKLMSNVCDFLACIQVPKTASKDSQDAAIEYWSKPKGKEDQLVVNAKEDKKNKKVKLSPEVKKLKSKFSRVWLTFLQLPLTTEIYEKALGHMHKAIIPNLTNPLLLSDFLTNSYNKGGLISVMALSGLFSLITDYGLEYPEYYNKLYALLEPSIFMAKYRARFFELLDLSLKSPLLPAYLAAAFAKKLGRMALKSPPAGALIVIAIVHNLLRRHPSINFLVHQIAEKAESALPSLTESTEKQENSSAAEGGEETQEIQQAGEAQRKDPFTVSEQDPAKSNALKSSLWEMDTLRRHYSPVVSRFVASLEADLTIRAKTTELNVKDFSAGSYATIFSEEVKRRMKQVPLAFYKSVPTMLFSKPLESQQSRGLVDFPGWSFGCKESFGDDKLSCGGNGSIGKGTSPPNQALYNGNAEGQATESSIPSGRKRKSQ